MAVVGEVNQGGDDSSSKIYPDVNGDYKVTAVDAMLVLNGLSGMANSGEGEQVVAKTLNVMQRTRSQRCCIHGSRI